MKKIICSIFVLISILASAQSHIKVKGVELKGSLNEVISKLKATGLKDSPYRDSTMDPILIGSFSGLEDCNFIFAPGVDKNYVVAVQIMSNYYSSWTSVKSDFYRLKGYYEEKYGEVESYEFFSDPFSEGDGNELRAVKEEKCTYAFYVFIDEGTIEVKIDDFSDDKAVLSITYTDAINLERYGSDRRNSILKDI